MPILGQRLKNSSFGGQKVTIEILNRGEKKIIIYIKEVTSVRGM